MTDIAVEKLPYAIAYIRKGWKVFPVHTPMFDVCSCGHDDCGNIGKHPRTENGLKDATTDERQVLSWWRKWPDANVGVVTGRESGVFVLDVDDGKGGLDALSDLEERNGVLPETVTAETGNGFHLLFRHPGRKVKTTNNQISKGLDVRGDGGYIVAPPSEHIIGKRYRFRDTLSPKDVEVADAPKWLLDLVCEKETSSPSSRPQEFIKTDIATVLLGRALADATEGRRNDIGLWLAVQLRDNVVSQSEAEGVMIAYCQRCPQTGKRYTEREALATLKSAFSKPPREPWTNGTEPEKNIEVKQPDDCAAAELKDYLQDIIDGKIQAVPMPWHYLTHLTQALIPSSVMVVCGDPGIGKTFWTLQNLRHWICNGFDADVFFVEKDRKFHTHRIMAQLEQCGNYCDFGWIRNNAKAVMEAESRHHEMVKMLGQHIHSETETRVNTRSLITWMNKKLDDGSRVLVVDPITMVDGGKERYLADDQFMFEAQRLVTNYRASLVLITHPKKGNTANGMGQMAAGAAYERFCDTGIWLYRTAKPKRVEVQATHGKLTISCDLFASMFKTRNGRGAGNIIALTFEKLLFAEQGLVVKEIKKGESGEDDD